MARAVAEKVEVTRTAILEAAKSVLREQGYAGLSTRAIAATAGIPLSQIHYHFGSKQGLMIALFEFQNAQLLERQQRMFADLALSLSEQWDMACDFLEEDLASGYVRVLQELWAAGWSDPEIAKVVREVIMGWHRLLETVAQRVFDRYGPLGPFTPRDIAALIGCAFIGAEAHILLGIEERDLPVRESLRRVADAIRLLENRVS